MRVVTGGAEIYREAFECGCGYQGQRIVVGAPGVRYNLDAPKILAADAEVVLARAPCPRCGQLNEKDLKLRTRQQRVVLANLALISVAMIVVPALLHMRAGIAIGAVGAVVTDAIIVAIVLGSRAGSAKRVRYEPAT